MTTNYHFTRDQLTNLLLSVVDMFTEYRDLHSHEESSARLAAADEMLEGLDAERELVAVGEHKASAQLIDPDLNPFDHLFVVLNGEDPVDATVIMRSGSMVCVSYGIGNRMYRGVTTADKVRSINTEDGNWYEVQDNDIVQVIS